jgi:hypothetical protein
MNNLDVVLLQVRNETAGLLDHARVVETRERKVYYRNLESLDLGSQNAAASQRRDVHFKLATVTQQLDHLDQLAF